MREHSLYSYYDVKHALLELEDDFRLRISEMEGKYILQFDDTELYEYLCTLRSTLNNSE